MSYNNYNKHELIEKAWCDKTDFDTINSTENLNENSKKKSKKKELYSLEKKSSQN